MTRSFLVTLVSLCLIPIFADDRAAALVNLTTTPDGLVNLNLANYKKFVLSKPRPYHLFVLFTSEQKYCKFCKNYETAFRHVAESFKESRVLKSYHHPVYLAEDGKPVAFAIVDIGTIPQIVKTHGIQAVPLIARIAGFNAQENGELHFKPRDTFPITKLDPAPSDLLEWVNNQCKSTVRLYFTMGERLKHFLVFACAGLGLLFLAFWLVIQARKRKWVLVTVPLLIQYISTSGLFYNIMNGIQWTGPDGSFVMKYGRGQFLGEGLAMSLVISLSGLALLAAVRLPVIAEGKISSNMISFGMLGLAGLGFLGVNVVLGVYKLKTGWYSEPPFFPPHGFKTGPVRVDQGNSL